MKTLLLTLVLVSCGSKESSGGSSGAAPAVDAAKTSEAPEGEPGPFVGTFHMECTNGKEITVVNTEATSKTEVVSPCGSAEIVRNAYEYEIVTDKGEGAYDVRVTKGSESAVYEWVLVDGVVTMVNANVGFKAYMKKVD